jgi:hypothetical protein
VRLGARPLDGLNNDFTADDVLVQPENNANLPTFSPEMVGSAEPIEIEVNSWSLPNGATWEPASLPMHSALFLLLLVMCLRSAIGSSTLGLVLRSLEGHITTLSFPLQQIEVVADHRQ